jgi:hypothetical protein
MASSIGRGRKLIFLMGTASQASVDQVSHFQDNRQQPEIDDNVITENNKGNGEDEDHRNHKGAQCNKRGSTRERFYAVPFILQPRRSLVFKVLNIHSLDIE